MSELTKDERIAELQAEIKTINHAVRINSYDTNDALACLVRMERENKKLQAVADAASGMPRKFRSENLNEALSNFEKGK